MARLRSRHPASKRPRSRRPGEGAVPIPPLATAQPVTVPKPRLGKRLVPHQQAFSVPKPRPSLAADLAKLGIPRPPAEKPRPKGLLAQVKTALQGDHE